MTALAHHKAAMVRAAVAAGADPVLAENVAGNALAAMAEHIYQSAQSHHAAGMGLLTEQQQEAMWHAADDACAALAAMRTDKDREDAAE